MLLNFNSAQIFVYAAFSQTSVVTYLQAVKKKSCSPRTFLCTFIFPLGYLWHEFSCKQKNLEPAEQPGHDIYRCGDQPSPACLPCQHRTQLQAVHSRENKEIVLYGD